MAKLWLDDVRKPDDSWTWCKSADDAIAFVKDNPCEAWSLDFDLGGRFAHYGTGPYEYNAKTGLAFIEMAWGLDLPFPDRIAIHSNNSAGVGKMVMQLHGMAIKLKQNIMIVVQPMVGTVMDRTPYHDPALRAKA